MQHEHHQPTTACVIYAFPAARMKGHARMAVAAMADLPISRQRARFWKHVDALGKNLREAGLPRTEIKRQRAAFATMLAAEWNRQRRAAEGGGRPGAA